MFSKIEFQYTLWNQPKLGNNIAKEHNKLEGKMLKYNISKNVFEFLVNIIYIHIL